MQRTAISILAVFLFTFILTACTNRTAVQQQQDKPADAGVSEDGGTVPIPPEGLQIGQERDFLPEPGDIIDIMTAPNGAKAYDKINNDGLSGTAFLEYQGERIALSSQGGVMQFSPDGTYLLYAHREDWRYDSGMFLYNLETRKTYQLTSTEVPSHETQIHPDYVPEPYPYESIVWGEGQITYHDVDGGTQTLRWEEE